ncbi:flagellin [Pyrofollis japonicus]|uniref:archaellin/type IV pilin N-terminal domain-containing protein n=1 Tax=Pyrofollis japonicus TaxID=3060460 RepID=UPI00295B0FCD|nr:archaellin/type IV pilin N-terminal domain-containing protein [Pyrofollis japonicus]BEP18208.1 flagellin [Pyrofollis japonicus]
MAGLRGIVGIEAAIVLIAFVLVASALAFVAINMGMFSAQKSKEVMAKAYDTATRALDVAGDALAHVQNAGKSDAYVDGIVLPIKLTAGAAPIDLNKTVVTLILANSTGKAAMISNAAVNTSYSYKQQTNITVVLSALNNNNATWVFATNTTGTLLKPGDVALLVVKAPLEAYGWIQIEVKPPVGAPLVVRYSIPPVLTSQWIDLVLGQ